MRDALCYKRSILAMAICHIVVKKYMIWLIFIQSLGKNIITVYFSLDYSRK